MALKTEKAKIIIDASYISLQIDVWFNMNKNV